MIKMKLFALLFFLFFISVVSARAAANTMRMAGGYSPADLDDARLLDAASFAMTECRSSSRTNNYSFAKESDKIKYELVTAYQQVVAGMNYRMILKVVDDTNHCVGGFAATVYYRLDGGMEVTNWGLELSCDKVKKIEKEKGMFHSTYNQDF
jgi:hypothetical protein